MNFNRLTSFEQPDGTRAQVAQEQYTITAFAEIENSRIALMQLLNLPYDNRFNIEIPAIDTLSPENLPEISAYA